MAGFGCERYAQGTIAPLRAQALTIRDARDHVGVLIAADIIAFDHTTVQQVRRSLLRTHGLSPSQVMLAASHTHWGPPTLYRMNYAAGVVNPWYLKFLEDTLIRLAGEALAKQIPAKFSYTVFDTRIGACRRTPDGHGSVKWGPYPEGSYDPRTPVLCIDRGGRAGPIVLVSHACHPTSSGSVAKWSPEYPGAMRLRIEQGLGSRSRAMFAMGCGADAKVTRRDRDGKLVFAASPLHARQAGTKLANAVLDHLASASPDALSPQLTTTLAAGSLTFGRRYSRRQMEELAYETPPDQGDRWWARQAISCPFTEKRCRYEVQAWRLGDLTLIGLEGEVCSGLGPIARALARTPLSASIAYVNDAVGYIPTAQIVREGGYEGESAHRAYFLPAPFTRNIEREFAAVVRRAVAKQSCGPIT